MLESYCEGKVEWSLLEDSVGGLKRGMGMGIRGIRWGRVTVLAGTIGIWAYIWVELEAQIHRNSQESQSVTLGTTPSNWDCGA